ncbi:MAG: hypothetical protein ACREQV_00025 [Candidatus Binatia bacterium]
MVGIEGDQDINIEDFYVQVKLRSGLFSVSRVSKAIRQIFKQFSTHNDRRYRLYCYFEGKQAGDRFFLDADQLASVLGADVPDCAQYIKQRFLERFEIVFAPDFEGQFRTALAMLKENQSLKTDEEAVVCHAILRQYLTDLVLSQPQGARKTSAEQLIETFRSAQRAVFLDSYQRHLGKERYLRLLKSEIGPKSVNVARRQRLVIVEVDPSTHTQDIIDLASAVRGRFYVRDNSPAPYLLFRELTNLSEVKRQLWDVGVPFTDGTHFDGDRFRIESLIGKVPPDVGLRLVDPNYIGAALERVTIQEVYDFFVSTQSRIGVENARIRRMAVDSVNDVTQILSVVGRP